MYTVKIGDYVIWKWAGGMAEGTVLEIHPVRVSIESKGKLITRNGTAENPAAIIKHKSGILVLKLASEVKSTDGLQNIYDRNT